jgi:hypothetical protein
VKGEGQKAKGESQWNADDADLRRFFNLISNLNLNKTTLVAMN